MKWASTSRTDPGGPGAREGRTWLSRASALALLVFCVLPLAALTLHVVSRWRVDLLVHLGRTVLPGELVTSAMAAAGAVLVGTALSLGGVLCAIFDFPGRSALERVLLVPLLVPAWYLAVLAREQLGTSGLGALVLVLGISSAPIFQLFAASLLRRISGDYQRALRQAGHASAIGAVRYLLPLSTPAFGVAAIVVTLLALGDDGCARVLAVGTLTVGLHDQWFGRADPSAGTLVAALLLCLGLGLAWAAWAGLDRRSWQDDPRLAATTTERIPLAGRFRALPWVASAPLLLAGVLGPGWLVVRWTLERLARVPVDTLGWDLLRSATVALGATAFAAGLALVMLRDRRVGPTPRVAAACGWLAVATFALPPLLVGLAWLELLPREARGPWSGLLVSSPLPLSAALGLRYSAVFVVMGLAALLRSARDHTDVLRTTGHTSLRSFARLLRPWLATPSTAAGCFVFLQTLQDLSLTQILRPFGFDTVSGRIFQYAQTQRVAECAVWILCLALAGLYPLFLLARTVDGGHAAEGR